jgi:signal transduction histidine kinase
MLRLTFAARIVLIGWLAIGAAWMIFIAMSNASRSYAGGPLPPPAQLAALAEAIEDAPPAQRAVILRAATSDTFFPRLEPGLAVGESSRKLGLRFGVRTLSAYRDALADRPMSITVPADAPPIQQLGMTLSNALEFRVKLRTGETLVAETRSAILMVWFGLPLGFGAALIASAIGLGALYIIHRQARPLSAFAAAVDRMDLAGTPERLPDFRSRVPEIQALVSAFNRLQGRLSDLLKARMAMLGGISHDVRSFATRLRLRVEQIPDAAERDRAAADIADMIRLLDDALLTSRAGAGELAEEMIEIAPMLQEDIADRAAAGSAVALHVDASATTAVVIADRLAIRRIVGNLIDNALTYGTRASLVLASSEGEVSLTVDDNGPGIPEAERRLVLEPFVRLEESRSRRTGGAGLGLAVVVSLVEAHGGALDIGAAPGGGARLLVRLPRFQAR